MYPGWKMQSSYVYDTPKAGRTSQHTATRVENIKFALTLGKQLLRREAVQLLKLFPLLISHSN